MTKDEALKLALEALEDLGMKHYESTGEVLYKETFAAIKEALAQRTWVGLTDEDVQDVIKRALQSLTNDSNTFTLSGNMIWVAIVKEVEAKLKEKNT